MFHIKNAPLLKLIRRVQTMNHNYSFKMHLGNYSQGAFNRLPFLFHLQKKSGLTIFIYLTVLLIHTNQLSAQSCLTATEISEYVGGLDCSLDDYADFGYAIESLGDFDGDGITDMAVGAIGHSTSAGAVYMLMLNADGTVKSKQEISRYIGGLTGLQNSYLFGSSITNMGDFDGDGVTDIAVGATFVRILYPDGFNNTAGAVYMLMLNADGTVKTQKRLTYSENGLSTGIYPFDDFGSGVANIGDLDGDGVTDIVVGAGGDRGSLTGSLYANFSADRGAVYVLFLNPDGSVKAEQRITEGQGGFSVALEDKDEFGNDVREIGDLNGDGITDIIVGAPGDDDGGTDRGAVYILFLDTDGSVKDYQKISSTEGGLSTTLQNGGKFGFRVESIGDLDGDGIPEIAVGAKDDNDGGTSRGALYLIKLNADGTVKADQKISDTEGGFQETLENDDFFGTGVGVLGDLDGDGYTNIAVGHYGNGNQGQGGIYIIDVGCTNDDIILQKECPDTVLNQITASVSTACLNDILPVITNDTFDLVSQPGSIVFDGSEAAVFQWQQSSDGSNWEDISGATSQDLTTPVVVTGGVYIRRVYTFECCGITSYSNEILITQVNESPEVTIMPLYYCPGAGQSSVIDITVTGGASPFTYSWSPAAGLNMTNIAEPTVTFGTNDIYELTVTGADGCQAVATAIMIPIQADAGGATTYICEEGGVQIGRSAIPGISGITYSWSPTNDLSCSDCPNPIANPATTTTYTLTIDDGSACTNNDQIQVIPNAYQADAGADVYVCRGTDVTIGTPNQAAIFYGWSPGLYLDDQTIAQPTFFSGVVPDPNPYTYILTTFDPSNGNCYSTDTLLAHVAWADAGAEDTVTTCMEPLQIGTPDCCNGQATYEWTILSGDANSFYDPFTDTYSNTSNIPMPYVLPTTQLTEYQVRVTWGPNPDNSGGADCTDSRFIDVPCSGCPIVDAQFINTVSCGVGTQGTIIDPGLHPTYWTFSWTRTDGNPVTNLSCTDCANPSLLNDLTADVTYRCDYTSTIDNNITCFFEVDVFDSNVALPTPLAQDGITCNGIGVQIGNSPVVGWSYSWLPTTGLDNPSSSNPTAMPTQNTQYTLFVTDDATGCTVDTTITVYVFDAIGLTKEDMVACNGQAIQIGAPAQAGYTYSWSPSTNLDDPNIANPTVSFNGVNITYTLTVTSANGCSEMATVSLTNTPSFGIIAGDISVCEGGSATLSTSIGGASSNSDLVYSWSPTTGLSCSDCPNPTVSGLTSNTVYTVTLSAPGGTCAGNDNATVTVLPPPSVTLSDQNLCTGSVQIGTIPLDGYSYKWLPETGLDDPNIANPNAAPSVTTTYTLFVTNGNGCMASFDQTVNVLGPQAEAGADLTICEGEAVTIGSAAASGVTYTWSPTTNLSNPNIPQPTANPDVTTTYTLTTTSGGCSAVDEITITVIDEPLNVPSLDPVAIICESDCQTIGIADNPNYEYQWLPASAVVSPNASMTLICPSENTALSLIVTDPATGCNKTQEIEVYMTSGGNCFEICDNGIDDDGDGLIDCDDPDCNAVSFTLQQDCPTAGIDLTATGGTAPYSFIWDDMPLGAHWTFENTTDDMSGNGNHEQTASSIGTPTYSNDAVEGQYSLSLDGGTYLRYSQDNGASFMETAFTQLSVSFWMKPTGLSGNQTIIDEGGGTNGLAVYLVDNVLNFSVRDGGSQVNANTHLFPSDGGWHHVAAVYDNGLINLFLDGVGGTPVSTGFVDNEISAHSGNGGIGYRDGGSGNGGGSGDYYTGLLDDFRYFADIGLSDSQVADLSRNDGDRTGLSSGTYNVTVTSANGVCPSSQSIAVDFGTCSEICDNGIDDDADGLVDCNDPDCPGVTVQFENTGCVSLDLYWNNSGTEIFYATIDPDEIWSQATYPGNELVIRENSGGYLVSTYNATNDCIQSVQVKTRDRISITNNGCNPVNLYCDEITADGITYDMGIINVGDSTTIWPSADSAHIYAIDIVTGDTVLDERTNLTDCFYNYEISCVSEICDNGLDDDGDGSFDSNDPDCSTCSVGLLSNSDFASNLTNWTNQGNTTIQVESNGNKYARISGGQGGFVQGVATTEGTTITLSFFGKKTGTEGGWGGLTFHDAGGTKIGADQAVQINSSNFQQYNISFVAPANAVSVRAFGWKDTGTGTLDLDGFCLTDMAVEICDNGLDDDGDGLTDCDDPDCSNSFTVTTNATSPSICVGGNTTISANASGGSSPYTYVWDNGLGNSISHNISPLTTTTYTVTVTSSTGCTSTAQVTITVNYCAEDCNDGIDNDGDGLIDCDDPDCGLSLAATPTDASCGNNDGQVTITASGGSNNYEYSDDNTTWLPGNTFSSLSPGNHTFYARNDNGTCTASVDATVGEACEDCSDGVDNDGDGLTDCADPDCAPVVSAGSDVSICGGASIGLTATASGGSTPYTYAWDNGLGAGSSKSVSPASTTTYTVTVTSASGCTSTAQVTVTVNVCTEDCTDGVDNDGDGLVDCDDPDCQAVGMPQLVDDVFSSCPGIEYNNLVSVNDVNLQSPVFTIAAQPLKGTVTINDFGAFTYTPADSQCGVAQFTYQVCNSVTGCCATAQATINIGDSDPPTLQNVPADITISCDDEIPVPPIVFGLDACPGIYIQMEETDDMGSLGACGNYTITRTWTTTDLCGNSASQSQQITVTDQTKPEMFRVYTLPNGKKLVAGNAQRTSHLWKYVKFPIHFDAPPLVFAQVTTEGDAAAVAVQTRYISTTGFEVRLREEEAADQLHGGETVSWMALEPGTLDAAGVKMVAGFMNNANHNDQSLTYPVAFSSKPAFISSVNGTAQADPVSVRIKSETASGLQISLQEEQSADSETNHPNEKLAWLAVSNGLDILDENGGFVAESGTVGTSHAWTTVNLAHRFTKPVVLFGGLSTNAVQAAVIRVRNVTQNSFQVRVQEWDYLDGNHGNETLGYLVVEGSIPTDEVFYCFNENPLQPGQDIIAIDNCDGQVAFGFIENENMLANGIQSNSTWTAIDDCGNVNLVTRYDTCRVAAFRLKTLLAGGFVDNFTADLMQDGLRGKGYLPTEEPYAAIQSFNHKGLGGNEIISPGLLDITGSQAVTDWLFVECRDTDVDNTVLSTSSILLRRDGSTITAEGEDVIYLWDLPEGDYYISARHRNHLGMITDTPWELSSENPPLIDLTIPATAVRGGASAGSDVHGLRAMWAGDFNSDGQVIFQGPYNDVFFLFSKVLSEWGNVDHLANYISYGYNMEDFNLDGRTIFQGPNNDRSMVLYHTVLKHKQNSEYLANFIVVSAMP